LTELNTFKVWEVDAYLIKSLVRENKMMWKALMQCRKHCKSSSDVERITTVTINKIKKGK
jgi:hypothetical protein